MPASATSKKQKPPAAPRRTVRELVHMPSAPMHRAYVDTTSRIPQILRKAKARPGKHVDSFIKDFETISSALRSVSLDGMPGGGRALPLPLAQIQAQDRLKAFAELYPASFLMCRLILVDSVIPSAIPVPPARKKKGGVNRMIQEAVADLAGFYTPKRTKPDRALLEFAKRVEAERLA